MTVREFGFVRWGFWPVRLGSSSAARGSLSTRRKRSSPGRFTRLRTVSTILGRVTSRCELSSMRLGQSCTTHVRYIARPSLGSARVWQRVSSLQWLSCCLTSSRPVLGPDWLWRHPTRHCCRAMRLLPRPVGLLWRGISTILADVRRFLHRELIPIRFVVLRPHAALIVPAGTRRTCLAMLLARLEQVSVGFRISLFVGPFSWHVGSRSK